MIVWTLWRINADHDDICAELTVRGSYDVLRCPALSGGVFISWTGQTVERNLAGIYFYSKFTESYGLLVISNHPSNFRHSRSRGFLLTYLSNKLFRDKVIRKHF